MACHGALRALQLSEAQGALASGVNMIFSRDATQQMALAGMLAATGRSRTFDARADGYARGEACCVVHLRRLVAVEPRGGRLLGGAVRQDGRSASLTAPNGQAQQALLNAAIADAATMAAWLAHIEAHGTGTTLGDPIEVGALREAVACDHTGCQALVVGGMKANAGHAEPAAGLGGLLRLLHARAVAPNAQLRTLNPHLVGVGGARGGCALTTQLGVLEAGDWGGGANGVSSFGYSGTIAHMLIRAAAWDGCAYGDPTVQTTRCRRFFPLQPPISHLSPNPSPEIATTQLAPIVSVPSSCSMSSERRVTGTYANLQVQSSTRLVILQLNDPDHFNTLSAELAEDVDMAVRHVQRLGDVAGVVLEGSGPHFSAGGNPWQLRSVAFHSPGVLTRKVPQLYSGFLRLRSLRQFVACAVHGALIGGGIAACMHADYLAADSASTFEHGNLVRGVCPLGMLSATFAAAVGARRATAIYLQNAILGAAEAHSLGIVHQLCGGTSMTKRHACSVAHCVSLAEVAVATVRTRRLPLDTSTVASEAIGHVACLCSNGGMTRSTGSTHRDSNFCEKEFSQAYHEDLLSIQLSEAQDVAMLVLDALKNQRAIVLALDRAVQWLHAVGNVRVVVLIFSDEARAFANPPSTRTTTKASHALRALQALGVPLLCGSRVEIEACGPVCAATWLAADYRVCDQAAAPNSTANVSFTSTFQRAALRDQSLFDSASKQRIGLVNELIDCNSRTSRTLQFANWLKQHTSGLKSMLGLSRAAQRVPSAFGVQHAWCGRVLHACATTREACVQAQRASAAQEGFSKGSRADRSERTRGSLALQSLRSSPPRKAIHTTPSHSVAAGIHAIELYTPRRTALGRGAPGFLSRRSLIELCSICAEDEDTLSVAYTAMSRLLHRYEISPAQIGQLQIHSATLLDRSKSMKSALMALLEASGYLDVEGVDCYGDSLECSLLGCTEWLSSSHWDGRWAVHVCIDGPPCAVGTAVLIGPEAPMKLIPMSLQPANLDEACDSVFAQAFD